MELCNRIKIYHYTGAIVNMSFILSVKIIEVSKILQNNAHPSQTPGSIPGLSSFFGVMSF